MLFQQHTSTTIFCCSFCLYYPPPSWYVRDVRKYMSFFSLYYQFMDPLCMRCLICFRTCRYDLHPQTLMAVNCRSSLPTGEKYFHLHVLNQAPIGLKPVYNSKIMNNSSTLSYLLFSWLWSYPSSFLLSKN